MRNLKRALSLVIASVMLLGMMVVGASANNFSDADEIVNKEAVEVTAGLGLFAGTDGKFLPKDNVTRAQMATIIVKMLYGSEINADQYKGIDKFSDTASFEGGWAEGYINLCANLGIVSGYGDGTFKPGNEVTTAEAVTMIINALGVDAGVGTWPLTVMSKAEEMKLFDELSPKPGTNEALIRDQLASIVLEGLEYSPAGTTGYKVPGVNYVFTNYADALNAAISLKKDAKAIEEVVGEDTLASKTFSMKSAEGMITDNQSTNSDYEYTVIGGGSYNIETGLDQVGHWVTVYYKDEYKSEKEPGTTYAVVDECDVYTVDTAITKSADFKAKFGSKDLSPDKVADVTVFKADYTVDTTAYANQYNYTNKTAAKGTYVVYDGKIISYLAPAAPVATYVTNVTTSASKEAITLAGVGKLNNNEDEDVVKEYSGIAKDDVLVAVQAGDTYTLTKADTIEGKVTKAYRDSTTNQVMLTISGTTYAVFDGATNLSSKYTTSVNVSTFDMDPTYRFFYTAENGIIAIEKIDSQADLSNIVYVVYAYTTETEDDYGNTVVKVNAQAVDMDGKVNTYLLGIYEKNSAGTYVASETNGTADSALTSNTIFGQTFSTSTGKLSGDFEPGFYTFEKRDNSKMAALGLMKFEAVKNTYNSTSNPIYSWTTNLDKDMDKKTTSVKLAAGDKAAAYLKSATKFISYKDTGASLTATVTTGSMIYDVSNGANLDVLLSRDSSGNAVLEAVLIAQDPEKVSTGDYIYIVNYNSRSADGYVYNAYTSDGTKTTITTENKLENYAKKFFSYSVNEKGLYDVTEMSNIYTFANQKFDSVYNNLMVAGDVVNFDISNAKLIDARTSDEIKDNETVDYAIETIEELISLQNDDDTYDTTIMLDIYADDEVVSMIFIRSIKQVEKTA